MNKKMKGALLILVLGLFSVRLSLPYLLKDYVNDVIENVEGYEGHVSDVGLSLYRGAYSLKGMELVMKEKGEKYPLFNARDIDISIHWHALLRGELVAEVFLSDFFFDLDAGPLKERNARENIEEIKKTDETVWLKSLRALVPIKINVIGLKRGNIIIAKNTEDERGTFAFENLNGELLNLRNVIRKNDVSPSTFNLTGIVFKEGYLEARGGLNFLTLYPQYDVKAKVTQLPLKRVNYFSQKYAFLDFHSGELDLYAEVKTEGKKIEGYIKPVFDNIEVFDLSEEEGGFINLIWQGIAASVLSVLENGKTGNVATVIPIQGMRRDPQTDNIVTFNNLLYNAFIKATDKDFARE